MANSAFDHSPSIIVPGSTTDNAVVRWDGTGGKTYLNSGVIIADTNAITGITALTVDNLNIDGNTLTATSGAVNITPAAGSAIVLDGAVNVDAGVVTGVTALTATTSITLNARGELRLADSDSSHYIALESPATVGTSYVMALPAAVPSANDYLKVTSYSGGAGVLEWATAGATDISCRVYSSAAQTADNNVDQTITFNQESYDTDNMHDNSTDNSRIKATTAGKYMIVVNVEWAANGTGWRNHYLRHSSGDTIASTRLNTVAAPSKCVVSFTGVWNFAANEYVELKVAQNSGSTQTINNGEGVTTIAMHKIN